MERREFLKGLSALGLAAAAPGMASAQDAKPIRFAIQYNLQGAPGIVVSRLVVEPDMTADFIAGLKKRAAAQAAAGRLKGEIDWEKAIRPEVLEEAKRAA